ncbi:hypothetical protein [Caulobacter phage KcrB]|nr:hypothetical protein RW_GP072c [Caulobacter phage RW]WCA46376.1 hypothetical protein [Caulobacter phage KcrB]WCD56311.1 hypothetical protein [Caulobacter phage RLK]WNV48103.1 hypothetical protein GB2A_gp071c [Caulobacter phage GB2A]
MKHVFAMFTGKDNATVDLGRVLWAKMSLVYCAATFFALWKGHQLTFTDWAAGAGVILAGGGGALALKAKTEPERNG